MELGVFATQPPTFDLPASALQLGGPKGRPFHLARAAGAQSFFHDCQPGWEVPTKDGAPPMTATPTATAAPSSLLDELERALAAGSEAQRDDMLSRITDLFVDGAQRYTTVQIGLFDEVFTKLATAIEAKARAKLSGRLSEVPNAPMGVVRALAFDDDIEVARPMLLNSERLDDADLVATAQSKSQQHLAAIAQRKNLSEAVTDVLVTRGDREVAHTVARNKGARFSDAAFRLLVKRSAADDTLALGIGPRPDLPRQHFLELLEQASASVRARLSAENPGAGDALEGVLAEVVGGIRCETRKVSLDYKSAAATVEAAMKKGRLGEAEVYQFARERRFEETAVALSLLCKVELDLVERALNDRGHEILLILARLAGFSWTSAKAIVLLKCADRGISAQDLDRAMHSYANLQIETARRVLDFYNSRRKARGAKAPVAASA